MRLPIRGWDDLKSLMQTDRRAVAAALCALLVIVLGGTAVAVNAAGNSSNSGSQAASSSKNAKGNNRGTTNGGSTQNGSGDQGAWSTVPGAAPGTTTVDGVIPPVVGSPDGTSPVQPGPGGTVPGSTTGSTPGQVLNQTPTSDTGSPLTVEPTSSSITTYTPTAFAAAVGPSGGAIRRITWDFGDGTTAATDLNSCDTPANRAGASHSYRAPGVYTVTATAAVGTRCGIRGADATIVDRTSVTVGSGTLSSNGPAFPTVGVSGRGIMPEDPHVSIEAALGDADGYVSQVVFDWNEPGTLPSVVDFGLDECSDTPVTWPASGRTATADHDYTNPGTYRVTVTVTSVGCDGGSSQQAIGVIDVTAGGTAAVSDGSASN